MNKKIQKSLNLNKKVQMSLKKNKLKLIKEQLMTVISVNTVQKESLMIRMNKVQKVMSPTT